jgi:hypothetical protein
MNPCISSLEKSSQVLDPNRRSNLCVLRTERMTTFVKFFSRCTCDAFILVTIATSTITTKYGRDVRAAAVRLPLGQFGYAMLGRGGDKASCRLNTIQVHPSTRGLLELHLGPAWPTSCSHEVAKARMNLASFSAPSRVMEL